MASQDCIAAGFESVDPTMVATVTIVAGDTTSTTPTPTIRATWVEPSNPYIISFQFQWINLVDGSNTSAVGVPKDALSWSTSDSVQGSTDYGVRYRAAGDGVVGPWSTWIPVNSDDNFTTQEHLGALAELDILDGVYLAAATGGNGLIDTSFKNIAKFWGLTYNQAQSNPGVTTQGTLFGKTVATRTLTGTPPAGQLFGIGGGYGTADVRLYAMPVRPGDKVEGSSYFSCSGVDEVYAEVRFWDQNATPLQPPYALGAVVTDFSGISSAVGVTSLPRAGGFKVAPATAAYASFDVIARTTGAAAPNLKIGACVLRIAQAGATELAAFIEGVPDPGADVTPENTSQFVNNQGPLTTSTLTENQVANANVALGANTIIDSQFAHPATTMGTGYSSFGSVGITRGFVTSSSGAVVAYAFAQGSVSAGGVFDILQSIPNLSAANCQRYALPVTPGDRLYGSAMCNYNNGATGVLVQIEWSNSSGGIFNESPLATGGAANGGYSGDVNTTMSRVGGFATAPAGAEYATLLVRVVIPAGCSGDGHSNCAQPFLAKVAATQVSPPPYTPGPADRNSDPTGDNTALNIVGQAPIAVGTTTAAQALNTNVATSGGNQVVDSEFTRGLAAFGPGYSYLPGGGTSQQGFATGISNYVYARLAGQGTVQLGSVFDVFQNLPGNTPGAAGATMKRYGMAVSAGDRIFASAMMSLTNGAGHGEVHVVYYDYGFNIVGEAVAGSGGEAHDANAYGGDIQGHYGRVGGFVTIPGDVWYVTMFARVVIDVATTGDCLSFAAQPFLTKVPAGQVGIPPYNPGGADPHADTTSENTAAAIVSQAPIATGTTTAAQALNSNVPLGQNLVVNSDFARGMYGFQVTGGSSDGHTVVGGVDTVPGFYGTNHVLTSHCSLQQLAAGAYFDAAVSGWVDGSAANQKLFGFPAQAGDKVYATALAACHRCVVQLYILGFDANGFLVESYLVQGGRDGGGNGGDPANFDLLQIAAILSNSSTRYVLPLFRGINDGVNRASGTAGNDAYVFITEPACGKMQATQTAYPTYQPGPADPLGDQTSVSTAAAITAQSPLAANNTLSAAQVTNANVALGGENIILDTEFVQGTKYWSVDTGSTGIASAINVNLNGSGVTYFTPSMKTMYAQILGTPAAGTYWQLGGGTFDDLQVTAGERIYFSALVAYYRCQAPVLKFDLFNASGTYVSSVGVATTPTSALSGGVNMAGAQLAQGILDIPAGIVLARPLFLINSTGEASPYIFMAHPLVCKIAPGQNYGPAYTPGRTDPTADQTSANTALNIYNQGTLALQNSLNLATQTTGNLGASVVLYPNGTPVSSLQPAQASSDVTGLNVASRINSQGSLATQSSADLGSQTTGNLAATRTIYSTGTNVDALRPAQAGADVTNVNISNGFNNSGTLAYQSRLTGGSQLPYPVSTGTGATFQPRYPLSSAGVGQVNVAACTITLTNGTQYNVGSQTFSGVGGEVIVFYNLSTGGCDVQPPPAINAFENAYNYIPLGLQAPMTAAASGSTPATYSAPTSVPAAGGGGGIGGGPRYISGVQAQTQ